MKKNFMQIVSRQATLAAKAAIGKASAEELTELARLSKAIQEATGTADKPATTTLTTMTLAAYQVWHEAAMKSIEDGVADESLLPLVKRNLAAVKTQAKTKAEDVVAVEIPVAKTDADVMAVLEQRIAVLEARLAGKDTAADAVTDAGNGTDAAAGKAVDDARKADKPVSQALAMEAIETLLAKYEKIKGLLSSGTMTRDNVQELCDGDYALKEIILQSARVMAKAEELKAALAACLPAMEKLAKDEADAAADTDGETGGDAGGETDGDDGDSETVKGDDCAPIGSAWRSGGDLAPRISPEKHTAAIRNRPSSRSER